MAEQPVEGRVTSKEFPLSDGVMKSPVFRFISSEEHYLISETTISEGRLVFKFYLTPILGQTT